MPTWLGRNIMLPSRFIRVSSVFWHVKVMVPGPINKNILLHMLIYTTFHAKQYWFQLERLHFLFLCTIINKGCALITCISQLSSRILVTAFSIAAPSETKTVLFLPFIHYRGSFISSKYDDLFILWFFNRELISSFYQRSIWASIGKRKSNSVTRNERYLLLY